MYTKVDMLAKQMRVSIIDTLLQLNPGVAPEGKQALAVFNTLSWPRHEVIEVPLDEGLATMKQYSAFGRTGYALGKGTGNATVS